MKKIIYSFTFLLALSLSAQTSVRYYNLNVKRGQAANVLKLFTDFSEGGKWKSGGVMLQGVGFKNGVTHRIVVWGDPSNWGTENPWTEEKWELWSEKMNDLTYPNTPDSSSGSVLSFTQGGDWEKYPTARVYDVRVHEPSKFKSAWDKNVKAAKEILDGRSMGLVSYELGGTPGASHGLIIYGKDENDVQLTLRKIQKTKTFRDYIASRGKVDYIQTYQVKTAKRF